MRQTIARRSAAVPLRTIAASSCSPRVVRIPGQFSRWRARRARYAVQISTARGRKVEEGPWSTHDADAAIVFVGRFSP